VAAKISTITASAHTHQRRIAFEKCIAPPAADPRGHLSRAGPLTRRSLQYVCVVKTALALTFGSAKVSEPFPLVLAAWRAGGFNHFVCLSWNKKRRSHIYCAGRPTYRDKFYSLLRVDASGGSSANDFWGLWPDVVSAFR
jgi:hypothetical protein